MPVLKHAKKKLRQDKGRTYDNKKMKDLFKKLIKDARAAATPEALSAAFKSIDKAAKKHVIHKNKAARLKSSLSKASAGKTTAAPKKATTKKAVAKPAAKKSSTKSSAKKSK